MSDSEAGASHISDEEIPRRKLMKDDERMGDDQRIDSLFSSFRQWCDSLGQRGEQIADGFERIVGELDYLKFTTQSTVERQRHSIREIKEVDKMLASMEKEVAEVKEIVAGRHLEQEEAKKTRSNKRKYDSFGGMISSQSYPSMKQLERFERAIKTLKLQKEALQKDVHEQEKQLNVFQATTHELKHRFRKDLEEWEEAVKAFDL